MNPPPKSTPTPSLVWTGFNHSKCKGAYDGLRYNIADIYEGKVKSLFQNDNSCRDYLLEAYIHLTEDQDYYCSQKIVGPPKGTLGIVIAYTNGLENRLKVLNDLEEEIGLRPTKLIPIGINDLYDEHLVDADPAWFACAPRLSLLLGFFKALWQTTFTMQYILGRGDYDKVTKAVHKMPVTTFAAYTENCKGTPGIPTSKHSNNGIRSALTQPEYNKYYKPLQDEMSKL